MALYSNLQTCRQDEDAAAEYSMEGDMKTPLNNHEISQLQSSRISDGLKGGTFNNYIGANLTADGRQSITTGVYTND